jgi:hypothetical protein
VYIRNHDEAAKDVKDNESVVSDTEPKLEVDDFENAEEDPLTFASSSQHLSSFASVDPLALQTRSFSMSHDRSQPFPLNDSLSFDEPSRQGRSFYPTSTEYTDDYSSHAILKPTTSGLVTPDEHPGAFDYLSHAPFTASAASEHHRPLTLPMHQTSHFDNWYPPYRHNPYNSIEYGASQTLSQNPMHYPMPVNPPHAHDMPHGLPDMARERSSHLGLMVSRNSISKSF